MNPVVQLEIIRGAWQQTTRC